MLNATLALVAMPAFRLQQLLIFAVWSLAAAAVHAQSTVRLLCKGQLETRRDGASSAQKTAAVDVAIDLSAGTIDIDGDWGCLSDIGKGISSAIEYHCDGPQKARITDSEVHFFAKTDGPLYSGQSNVQVNRYSATFTVNSQAIANPAAKATWALIQVSGKLQCSSQDRKF